MIDILDEYEQQRNRRPSYPDVTVEMGMLAEDRSSHFTGEVVRWSAEGVTLQDRHDYVRHFGWKPGGFLIEGTPVTLVRTKQTATATQRITASGSIAGDGRAKVARASRIWVEGKHDAELLEHVWGDDLRELGIVVEPLHGADDLAVMVAEFAPSSQRRLGVLLDHLVAGSKESRIADTVHDPNVLITGHPFVDVWAGIRPKGRRPRRVARRPAGSRRSVEGGAVPDPRCALRRVLAEVAQSGPHVRRPHPRAGRRRRAASSTSSPRPSSSRPTAKTTKCEPSTEVSRSRAHTSNGVPDRRYRPVSSGDQTKALANTRLTIVMTLMQDVHRGARGVLERVAHGVADDRGLVLLGPLATVVAGLDVLLGVVPRAAGVRHEDRERMKPVVERAGEETRRARRRWR